MYIHDFLSGQLQVHVNKIILDIHEVLGLMYCDKYIQGVDPVNLLVP
jgi:hypothetical protein